jgi:hypothetical protein
MMESWGCCGFGSLVVSRENIPRTAADGLNRDAINTALGSSFAVSTKHMAYRHTLYRHHESWIFASPRNRPQPRRPVLDV